MQVDEGVRDVSRGEMNSHVCAPRAAGARSSPTGSQRRLRDRRASERSECCRLEREPTLDGRLSPCLRRLSAPFRPI
jgi:hypothetical protein